MSIQFDMTAISSAASLETRLERLTGTSGEVCLSIYRAQAQSLDHELSFRRALQWFRALSDRKRLIAVNLLRSNDALCACEIQAALGLSHPAVSYHMSILVKAGLVQAERRGKWVHFRLSPDGRHLPLS